VTQSLQDDAVKELCLPGLEHGDLQLLDDVLEDGNVGTSDEHRLPKGTKDNLTFQYSLFQIKSFIL